MSRFSRKLNRRRLHMPRPAPALPLGTGLALIRVHHDPGCKAPVLECTCKPDVELLTNPSRREWDRSFAVDRALRAEIRKGLS